jgi:hypothetical protein
VRTYRSVGLRIPVYKITVKTQTRISTFFGVKLYGKDIFVRNSTGKQHAVLALANG